MKAATYSAIIPLDECSVKNQATIDSVLRQTLACDQIVLLFNNEKQRDFLKKYDNQWQFLLGDSRTEDCNLIKLGASISEGDYICFVTPGDTWEPHFIEQLANAYLNAPGADAYAFGYQYHRQGNFIDPDLSASTPLTTTRSTSHYFEASKNDTPYHLSSTFIKKQTFLDHAPNGTPPQLTSIEKILLGRICLHSEVEFNPLITTFCEYDAYVGNRNLLLSNDQADHMVELYQYSREHVLSESLRQNIFDFVSRALLNHVESYLRLGELAHARKYLANDICKRYYARYLTLKMKTYL